MEYLRRVQLMNGIFFYQNRREKQKGVCDDLECKMQIANLQRHLAKGVKEGKEQIISKETAKLTFFSDQDLEEFNLFDNVKH